MKELEHKLDLCAAESVTTRDLWPDVSRRVLGQTGPTGHRTISRLGWIAIVVTLLVAVSTAAYAAAPILRDVYRINPNWPRDAAQASHPVQLTQTVDDCTVTVEQVYADRERILIGMTIEGPQGMSLSPGKLQLLTADGVSLPFVDGAGDVRDDGPSAWVGTFDTSALASLPSKLSLYLSLTVSGIPRQGDPVAMPPMADPVDPTGDAPVLAVELSPIETTVYGPFTFAFDAPVSRAAQD